ncbi:hypothetical protein [Formosa sp. L2A11]|uniref:hypothetical protein n=1 Tax=Formosa sp. L2A11 TaxID=2686363 RepID=UPI0018EF1FE9|nr:hypothetical protein [Formosa sp. L2A11]
MSNKIKLYRFKIVMLLVCSVLFTCKQKQKSIDGVAQNTNRLPYYQDASFMPSWFQANDTALKNFHNIPDFSLICYTSTR